MGSRYGALGYVLGFVLVVGSVVGGAVAVTYDVGLVPDPGATETTTAPGPGTDTPTTDPTTTAPATETPVPDSDGDGLTDERERALGTDPDLADTDRDGLADGWEYHNETPGGLALPGADPLSKDLYVRVVYGTGVRPLSANETDRIRRAWAEMPVGNPDGSEGVDVHVTVESRRSDATHGSSVGTTRAAVRRLTNDSVERHYYTVAYLPFEDDPGALAGEAVTPGGFAVVQGDADADTRSTMTVHELLHNTVGVVERAETCRNAGHTCEGWLKPTNPEPFLPPGVAEELTDHGLLH